MRLNATGLTIVGIFVTIAYLWLIVKLAQHLGRRSRLTKWEYEKRKAEWLANEQEQTQRFRVKRHG